VKCSVTFPNLETELGLLAEYDSVVCVDEVGRGAVAGPVVVGVTVFAKSSALDFPEGLRDSKLIPEAKREGMALASADWLEHAVGEVSAEEIDHIGISEALRKAAMDAVSKLSINPQVILLDGKHDWLGSDGVITQVKADQRCAAVSAASVIAKHYRDEIMRELSVLHPQYAWESNKGYASEGHIKAIQEHGHTGFHRKTWLTRIINSEQTLF
jgi:ribonuclease HII